VAELTVAVVVFRVTVTTLAFVGIDIAVIFAIEVGD
jgi:hypothetical protein